MWGTSELVRHPSNLHTCSVLEALVIPLLRGRQAGVNMQLLAPDGVAARMLLQTAASADTLDLRIIGVFIVFIAGFAGAALPLVSKV